MATEMTITRHEGPLTTSWHRAPKVHRLDQPLSIRDYHSDMFRLVKRTLSAKPTLGDAQVLYVDAATWNAYVVALDRADLCIPTAQGSMGATYRAKYGECYEWHKRNGHNPDQYKPWYIEDHQYCR